MLIVLAVEVVDGRRNEELDIDGRRKRWGFFGGGKIEFLKAILGKIRLLLMAWCFGVLLH